MAQIKVNQYSIPDDAITLAKMAGGTDGNIITYDASGNPAVVALYDTDDKSAIEAKRAEVKAKYPKS